MIFWRCLEYISCVACFAKSLTELFHVKLVYLDDAKLSSVPCQCSLVYGF